MTLSGRELGMACATGLLVLAAASYIYLEPAVKEIVRIGSQVDDRQQDIDKREYLIRQEPQWNQKWNAILDVVPRHQPDVDVTAHLMREIEQQARAHGYNVTRRNSEEEEQFEEYSTIAIDTRGTCESLRSIVSFLYNLKSTAAMMDVRHVKIDKDKFEYKVRVTINCIYGRRATGS